MFVSFIFWYMFRKFIGLAVLVICVSACNKEESPVIPPVIPSNDELLRSGSWQLTDHVQVIGANRISIYTANYPECERDNLFIFGDSSRFIVDEGALKCFSSSPQRDTIQWALIGDTDLRIIDDLDTTKRTINSISTSEMKLRFTASNNVVNELVYTKR